MRLHQRDRWFRPKDNGSGKSARETMQALQAPRDRYWSDVKPLSAKQSHERKQVGCCRMWSGRGLS